MNVKCKKDIREFLEWKINNDIKEIFDLWTFFWSTEEFIEWYKNTVTNNLEIVRTIKTYRDKENVNTDTRHREEITD